MKKSFLLLLLSLLLGGCANRYVITMNNGMQLDSMNKPHLQKGYYVYKDALGRKQYAFAGDVSEIAPARFAKKDTGVFKPTPQ